MNCSLPGYSVHGLLQKHIKWSFPGSTVEKNLPANAKDLGSIPGPGGSHMQLSPCITTTEPVL